MSSHGSRESRQAWMIANPEKVRSYKRVYYLRHKDIILSQQKAEREANKEGVLKRRRERYSTKREQIQALARVRYAEDREYADRVKSKNRQRRDARLEEFRKRDKQYAKAYQLRHPDRFRDRQARGRHKRRALQADAFIEVVDPTTVFKRDKGICGICHCKVDPKSLWHVDHVIPLSKGGMHSYVNVQLSHARCNWSKQGKLPKGQLGLFQRKADGAI